LKCKIGLKFQLFVACNFKILRVLQFNRNFEFIGSSNHLEFVPIKIEIIDK